MEFQTLRKSHKKQVIMGALVICVVGGALTFATTRAKYKVTQDIKLVNGTVNYKPYDFKIMAMYQQNDSGTYTEITDRMPSSGYVINESKSYCTLDNKNKDTEAILKTVNGNHVISNLQKSDKCYLWFDKEISAGDTIIAGITVKPGTPTFSNVATADEGVYAVSDGMYGGTSYYWRGAVTNNYVKFANKCWRIIRINGDGSIRLIYDGTSCHANGESTTDSIVMASQKYNNNYNSSSYVGWTYTGGQRPANNATATPSDVKIQTDLWFINNITNADKVVTGKFCNDRNTGPGGSTTTWTSTGTDFYYATRNRINTNIPTLSCPSGDVYELKVGAITADEAMYAGGKNANNRSYYLNNGQNYWTMSPSGWTGGHSYMFIIYNSGSIREIGNVNDSSYGLRPVINLSADATFSSGNGTQNNPYVVS